jgi:uncharacterized membrane protein YecN with MAPEG domain
MAVTALYAALLTFIYLALSFRVIAMRRIGKVSVGDGGNKDLLRRMRVHANFAEYAPLALVLMALGESMNVDRMIIHGLGILLLAGRAAHAWGMSSDARLNFRIAGMMLTFASLVLGALLCAYGALWHGV